MITIAVVLLLTVVGAMAQANLTDVQDRFDSDLASGIRANNFFCLERTTSPSGMVNYTAYEQNSNNVWTLFFQMPLLGFLDMTRKRALMEIITELASVTVTDVCLGTYEVYEIATFRESILIHLYAEDSNSPLDVNTIAAAFQGRVNGALSDGNRKVIRYPGQDTITAFDLSATTVFRDNPVLYAGDTSSDGATPLNLAVFLGSYPRNLTFGTPVSGVSEAFGDRNNSITFASNPNPINYGLEAGDIVFAVIGSILLTIVMFLILLGYFIHPFFLA